jgi:hypothetical protein
MSLRIKSSSFEILSTDCGVLQIIQCNSCLVMIQLLCFITLILLIITLLLLLLLSTLLLGALQLRMLCVGATYLESKLFLFIIFYNLHFLIINYWNTNCTQDYCVYIFSRSMMLGVMALIEWLLPKWYTLVYLFFCLCVYVCVVCPLFSW